MGRQSEGCFPHGRVKGRLRLVTSFQAIGASFELESRGIDLDGYYRIFVECQCNNFFLGNLKYLYVCLMHYAIFYESCGIDSDYKFAMSIRFVSSRTHRNVTQPPVQRHFYKHETKVA